jgi:RNA polymerase sigma factor (sigma-70 family)
VLRLCLLLLRDQEEATEVAHDVFIKAFGRHRRDDPPNNWRAWLSRVAANACHDRSRSIWLKLWHHAPSELTEADHTLDPIDPETRLHTRRQLEAVWRAFQALPARQAEVFTLRYLEEYTTTRSRRSLSLSTGPSNAICFARCVA